MEKPYFQSSCFSIKGTSAKEVYKRARAYFNIIASKSKRRPYIKSKYFDGQKIFFTYFWEHLYQKVSWTDRRRRLRYFIAGIELIEKSTVKPAIKELNRNNKKEMLYRFIGRTQDKELFAVQIKERISTGQKFLMSLFPMKKPSA